MIPVLLYVVGDKQPHKVSCMRWTGTWQAAERGRVYYVDRLRARACLVSSLQSAVCACVRCSFCGGWRCFLLLFLFVTIHPSPSDDHNVPTTTTTIYCLLLYSCFTLRKRLSYFFGFAACRLSSLETACGCELELRLLF